MVLFRTLGWFLVFIGLGCFAFDAWGWYYEVTPNSGSGGGWFALHLPGVPGFRFHAIGELWRAIDGNSIVGASAWIERSLGSTMHDFFIGLLTWPATLTSLGFGLILVLLFRRRTHRPRY